jgi:hypothetical protein
MPVESNSVQDLKSHGVHHDTKHTQKLVQLKLQPYRKHHTSKTNGEIRVIKSKPPSKYEQDYFQRGEMYNEVHNRVPKLLSPYLQPNATFVGEQQSNKDKYHIQVQFKTIDLIDSVVTGFLQIRGLAKGLSTMTTCFKGEIVNNPLMKYEWHNETSVHDPVLNNYSFITENKTWESLPKNDMEHWKRLTASDEMTDVDLRAKLARILAGEEDNHYIYMRWKEQFLLPDSRVKSIFGTSFEGFYYVVLNVGGFENGNGYSHAIEPGCISGLYYYKSSEKFQSLSLKYVDNNGVKPYVEYS